jgi:hypothetical protein
MSEINSSVPFKQNATDQYQKARIVFTDFLFECIQTMTDPAQTEAQNDDNND